MSENRQRRFADATRVGSMKTKQDIFYKSIIARRDPRFDGRFYFGVRTTRIYCRPVCPARPKPENIVIFRSSTEAEKSGYRPCLRCRPDLAPGCLRWSGTAVSVARALRLIDASAEPGLSAPQLAAALGMTARHLRRLFDEHLGASPIEVMITKRLHLARKLITETALPLTEIAYASGFKSIRRFNEAFKKIYRTSPSSFRKAEELPFEGSTLQLRLAVRLPYDWQLVIAFLERHESFGVEFVESSVYHRFIPMGQSFGRLSVSWDPKGFLVVKFQNIGVADLRQLVAQVKALFDVDHNPSDLPENPTLRPQGVRIPGSFHTFETAVSIILGQLVSSSHAKAKMKQLILRFGQNLGHPDVYRFPLPCDLKDADLENIGLTRAKAHAIRELARQVHEGNLVLSSFADLTESRKKLRLIKGIGPWTSEMIAMRCLSDSDAFPRTDLIVQRALELCKIDETQWMSSRSYLTLGIWRDYAARLSGVRKKPQRSPSNSSSKDVP